MAYKIAIVGAGMIANAAHIPAWENLESRAEIVGIVNRNKLDTLLNHSQHLDSRKLLSNLFEIVQNKEKNTKMKNILQSLKIKIGFDSFYRETPVILNFYAKKGV